MIQWNYNTKRKASKWFLLIFGALCVGLDSFFGCNLLDKSVFAGITVINLAGAFILVMWYLMEYNHI